MVIDGEKMFIPGGTNVGYCAWGIHRNKEIFGVDADMFRPERWLTSGGVKLTRMQKTADLVFGYGKYMCLGKPVAMLELNKVFVEVRKPMRNLVRRLKVDTADHKQLLRRFNFELVNSMKPITSIDMGLWIQTGFWVRITTRE